MPVPLQSFLLWGLVGRLGFPCIAVVVVAVVCLCGAESLCLWGLEIVAVIVVVIVVVVVYLCEEESVVGRAGLERGETLGAPLWSRPGSNANIIEQ